MFESYKILTPRTGYTSIETTPELHEEYIRLLANLLDDIYSREKANPEDLVFMFLDKSARPLSWMMRQLWDDIAPQLDGEATGVVSTVPLPEMKYINIDRLHWRNLKNSEMQDSGHKPVTDGHVQGIRSIFEAGGQTLDGKNIVIIDEQSESGDTLLIAKKLFRHAYPQSQVSGYAWVTHPSHIDADGRKKYDIKLIPAWYPLKDMMMEHTTITGRGVFDPISYSDRSERFRSRFPAESSRFLGTPPKVRIGDSISSDQASLTLRREIAQMAMDFREGDINPSICTERVLIRGLPSEEYNRAATSRRIARLAGRT